MRGRGLLLLLCAGGAAACASIWGFEDGVAAADAGIVDTEVVPAQGAQGVVCVPRGPADWLGPLVIAETTGAPAPEPPPCLAAYPKATDAFANLAPTECKCACGAATGVTCSAPVLSIFADQGTCGTNTGACRIFPLPSTNSCTGFPDAGCPTTNSYAKVTTPAAPTGGSCAPTGEPELDPAKWGAAVRFCSPPPNVPGTCPADKVATPVADLPYQTNYCFAVTGAAPCPALYPAQRVYYSGTSDTRKCTCACGAPKGGSCSATIEAKDNDDCTGAAKPTPTDQCTLMANASGIRLLDAGTPTGSITCDPTPDVAGELKPATPITICCRR